MSRRLVDRFHPEQRQREQELIEAGGIRKLDELALLEPEQLRPLATLSLWLFLVGGVVFTLLNVALYYWQMGAPAPTITLPGVLILILLNILGYILILPIHECIHGAMFALWGGKPHFGARLPLALYCGARQQLFRRNQYLAVGLAPLVIITLVMVSLIVFAPGVAAYLWLANVGNFSGAAGDVLVARRLWRLPAQSLVEDTETGYVVWEIVNKS